MQVLLTTCGSWHLRNTAKVFLKQEALAGLWISDKNSTGLPAEKYHRCWPFHLAMKPFYHCVPPYLNGRRFVVEHAFYALFPLWKRWLSSQLASFKCADKLVVQAIMGYATEAFDFADRAGALKVIDCQNSHPTTYYGFSQRECDLWCPGEKVPIPRRMFARMNRELKRADLILCPSTFVKDTMLANGIPEKKCFIGPFGVDTSVFSQRKAIPTRARFISVGMILLRKGHQYLFRAFELVKRALPGAELICVGEYKADFRRERPRWEGTFTHFPSLSHRELASLLTECTAFVLPSLEEGFARVVPEAMAAGLPIIASHESGATTLVQDGIEGFIIRPSEPRHIAEAMIRLAQDPSLNRRMGDAAYQKGAVQNTWQDYGDRLLEEYARRLASPRP